MAKMHLPKVRFRADMRYKLVLPFDLGDYNYRRILRYVRENPNCLLEIGPVLPESTKQRGYFEGGLVSLFVYYNGGDYKDRDVLADARHDLKMEFWSELRPNYVTGKVEKKVRSTKGREALNAVTERVLEYMIENYSPPAEALDPETYKHWRDVALMDGAPDNYLDYLQTVGVLAKRT